MYPHQIREMAQALVKAKVIKNHQVQTAEEALSAHWDDSIAVVWNLQDVIDHGRNMGIKVTKPQAREVLDYVFDKHDATSGINWDSIEHGINHVLA